MMRLADTFLARVLLISLSGITLLHLLSLWTYENTLQREMKQVHEEQLADKLISILRSVASVPETQREALAHQMSGGPVQAHWSWVRGAASGGTDEPWQLATRLVARSQSLVPDDVVVGTGVDPHAALLSLRLPDNSWLNVNLFMPGKATVSGHGHLLSTSLMWVGVALLSVLMATWLTWPLRRTTEAVSTLFDRRDVVVPENGPREVRQLAASFNAMHRRLLDLVERRTRSLAAVSHDLRTPLTRLKLRLGDVESPELQRAMANDLDDMEMMIEATLSYLKGHATGEPARPIDLVSLLETLVDDARDAGHDAELVAPATVVIEARLISLKRAFSNLIGNALRFGSEVRVQIERDAGEVTISIDDNGPGIPEDKLKVVFEPFLRLEESRNYETGGVGLGLTIAKSSIELDGGTLVLTNRPTGGLRAVARLPAPAALNQPLGTH